jgi:hypothetical protein
VTESSTLLRAGGYAAFLVIPVVIAAGIAFWLFLNGAGEIFGPINDLFVALALALLVLPVLAIRSILVPQAGPWFDVLSWLSVAGLVLAAVGQILLVIGVIPLEGSFVTGGLGIVPVLAWALGLGVLAGRVDALPDELGWVTVLLFGMIVVVTLGSAMLPGPAVALVSAGMLVSLGGWLVMVALTCLGAVAPAQVAVSG